MLALPRLAFLVPLLLASPAPTQASDWLTRDTLTGDWGGARTALADKGVTIGLAWTAEGLENAHGGMREGGTYDGLVELQLDADLEKIAHWKGATFHISGYWIQGEGLSANYVGNLLTVSNIEAQAGVRLNEVYLEQSFAADTLSLRLGQIAADQEFWLSNTAGVFINSTFGWPGINGTDLPGGGPAYPLPTPGVRLRWSPDAAWSVQGALYNGNPLGSNGNSNGLDFPVNDGVFAIVEASYTSAPRDGLSGTYKIGAWYNSNDFDDLAIAANGVSLADPTASGPRSHSGNYSLYAMVDHQLWARPGADGIGLSGFIRVAVTPEQDRNPIAFYVDTGLAYAGLLPGRPNDVLGLGFAYAAMSSSLADLDRATNAITGVPGPVQDYEAVIELTYQAALTPWLVVQPFFQYVIHPGGNVPNPDGTAPTQALGNAAIFGVRSAMAF